jgi:hypothetical protein
MTETMNRNACDEWCELVFSRLPHTLEGVTVLLDASGAVLADLQAVQLTELDVGDLRAHLGRVERFQAGLATLRRHGDEFVERGYCSPM